MSYSIKQFNERFPDDDACIAYMFEQAYGDKAACPKCGSINPGYYRVKVRNCYECKDCGYQLHALEGVYSWDR